MLIFLKLLISHWKDIAISIVLATLIYIIFAWWGANAEIANLKVQLSVSREEAALLRDRVAKHQEAELILEEKQKQASKERQQLASVLSKEINNLRNQIIPKECPQAVQYGIKYKDDLKWPGQQ